jgi:hypothetical protein
MRANRCTLAFLARKGHAMSADRAHRMRHRAGLEVPRRSPAADRDGPPAFARPDRANGVFAFDVT